MGMIIFKKIVAASVVISMVFPSASFAEMMNSVVSTSAGDIATEGSTQTGVDRAQNGVPLVNIAPPSGAGVSHNRYQDFNVGSEGAIMNNSSRMENSLLGGAVYANPNLKPGEEGARVILNEVTSTRASRLFGATEIHGRAAEYILANPNGITCNGCEFINTPRVLLGAGRPEMQNGDFMGLHMDPAGRVNIEGAGLNAGNVDYFEIVTRAAKINAGIHANDLSVKTGSQYYDAKTGKLSSGDLAYPQAPAVSVDSALLGGIAAGRITLESTELGVGVNLGGQLASRQDLAVTADGQIVYANAASETGSVAVQSKHSGIEQTGYAAAKNDVRLEAAGDINLNDGVVSAGADARINAGGDISNQADIRALGNAGIHAGGNVSNQADIHALGKTGIQAGNAFANSGNISSNEDVVISAGQDAALNAGRIAALGSVDVTASGSIENKAVVRAGGKAALASEKDFRNEGSIQAGSSVDITVGQNIDLAGGQVLANDDLNINSKGGITNSTELQAGRKITLKADQSVTNQDGKIHANGDVIIAAGQDVDLQAGEVLAANDLNVNAQGSFSSHAELSAGRNAGITAGKGAGFRGGQVMAGGNTEISVGEDINLESGKVLANQDLIVSVQGSFSSGGELTAGRNAVVTAGKDINLEGGKVLANENLGVKIQGAFLNNAQVLAGRNVDIASDKDVNFSAGEMAAGGDIQVKSGGGITNKAVIQSGGHATFAAGRDFNNESAGKLYSNGNTDISAGESVHIEGEAVARKNLNLTAKDHVDIKGEIQAARQVNLSAENAFHNQGIVLAGTKDNDGDPQVGLNIQAGSLKNSEDGQLLSHGNLSAAIDKDVDLAGGKVAANGDIYVTAKGNLTNQIDVQSGRNLTLTAEKNMINRGTLLAGNDLELTAASFSNDASGKVMSHGNASLTAFKNVNFTGGEMVALKDIAINAHDGIFNNADLHADGKLTLTTQKTFTNQKTLSAGTAARAEDASTGIRITADSVGSNSLGNLLSYGNLDVSVNQDLNLGGSLFSYGDMNITGNGGITNSTDIQSESKVTLTAGGDIRNNGAITGGKDRNSATGIALNSNALQNNGKLLSFGNMQVAVRQDLDMTGEIMTYVDLAVHGDKNITNKIDLVTGGRTDISAGLDFYNGYLSGEKSVLRQIQSDADIAITARNITNYGSIETGGNLILTAQSGFLNDRRVSDQGLGGNALLLSMGNTVIYADRITNSAGEILSMSGVTLQKDAQGNRSSSVDNLSGLVGTDYTSAVIEGEHDISIRSNVLNNLGYDYDPDLGGAHGYNISYNEPRGIYGTGYWSLMSEDVAYSTLKTKPSTISAGRDIVINGADILNRSSSISAGRNIRVDGGSLVNDQSGIKTGTLRRVYGKHTHWSDCGWFGCDHFNNYEQSEQYYDTTALSDFAPNFYALGTVDIDNVTTVTNGSVDAPHSKTYNGVSLDAVRQSGVIPILGVEIPRGEIQAITVQERDFSGAPAKAIAFDSKAVQSAYVPPKSPISLTDNSLFNLSALFGLSKNPESRYVIESRSRYTSLEGLKGSQYFLDRIGYNPHTDTQLLGDEHFQAKLIERSIREATGKVYLEQGVGSALDQLETLYNNAFEEFKDHNLSVGIALSSEQIAQLKNDIVWLVETVIEVNGKPKKVLVPQIYLARVAREGLENPTATIEGKIVSIRSNNDIVNAGQIVSKGDMALFSGQDILNQAGKISSGKDMLLSAGGSITSYNIKERKGTHDNWKDKITASGGIKAGQDAVLSAGKDINILGTGLRVGNDLGLSAGENVNIVADRLDSHFHRQQATGKSTYEHVRDSTRNLQAEVEAGGNLQIRSGKDIGIIGGKVSSGGDMALQGEGNITVASVEDRVFAYTRQSDKDQFSSEESVDMFERANQRSSSLNAGGNFSSMSGNDTNIIASNISAGGNGSIMAGSRLNILSAANSESAYSYHEKTGMDAAAVALGGVTGLMTSGPIGLYGGLKVGAGARRGEIRENESFHAKEAASNLNFGGNLTLASAGDINVISSKLESRKDINAFAGGGLLIGARKEIHKERHAVEEIKPDYAGVAAGAAVAGTVAELAAGVLAGGLAVGFAPVAGIVTADFVGGAAQYVTKKKNRDTDTTAKIQVKSSDIVSGRDMELSGEKEIHVFGSHLLSGNDIALKSEGDVTIAAFREAVDRKETHSESSFSDFGLKFNRSSVDINWSQKAKENEKETNRVTQKRSQLEAQGNILIRSGNDTNLVSSSLLADKEVKIEAGRDVNLLTEKESETVTERESSMKNTFTQTIGNSWLESGYAAKDSAVQLKATVEDEGLDTKEGKIKAAVDSAKATVAAYSIAKTAQSVANDATTAATLGFYSNFSMTQERETKSSASEKSGESGSGILSEDIKIAAGRNIGARGVTLTADKGNLRLKAGNDIKIESSESSAGTRSSREKESLETILSSTNGDFIPTLSVSRSGSSSAQVTHGNSKIKAEEGGVIIESGGNTDLLGVNVKAEDVDMKGVKGNLTLASKQDRSESKSDGYSFTVGRNEVGFSISQSESDEKWANSQSSIIGTESVAVNAKDLSLVGSVIANRRKDGTDGGNLTVTAERLNYQDLKDTSESSSFGFGMGTTLSTSKDKQGNTQTSWKGGSTHMDLTTGGHEKEGMTRATLGDGFIDIAENPENLAGLNRDVAKSHGVTKDKKDNSLKIELSVSNQFLVDAADQGLLDALDKKQTEVKETIRNFPKYISKAGKRVENAGGDLKRAIENALDSGVSPLSDYDAATDFRQASLDFQKDHPELAEVLNNKDGYGIAAYQKAMQGYVNYVSAQMGIEPINVYVYAKNDIYKGRSDNNAPNILINAVNTNLRDSSDMLHVLGHEVGHQVNGHGESDAELGSDNLLKAWSSENGFNGNDIGAGNIYALPDVTYADKITQATGDKAGVQIRDSAGLTIPGIGWVNLGESQGQKSAEWYADKFNESGTTGKIAYGTMGLLSSLWTPDTSDKTVKYLVKAYKTDKFIRGLAIDYNFPKNAVSESK